MTTPPDVTSVLTGVFPIDGGIMRKRILAVAGLAALGTALTSLGARADTYNLIGSAPVVSDAGNGLTDFTYSYTNLFTTAVESIASVNIDLGPTTTFWALALKITAGSTAASFGGGSGSQTYTSSADLQPGTYSFKLDAYVPNGGVSGGGSSPISSATLSVVAVPGPVAGAGPAGLIMCFVLGCFAFARGRSGGRTVNI